MVGFLINLRMAMMIFIGNIPMRIFASIYIMRYHPENSKALTLLDSDYGMR